jgi:hypothetical protein
MKWCKFAMKLGKGRVTKVGTVGGKQMSFFHSIERSFLFLFYGMV